MSEMEKRRRVFLTVGMKKELCQYKVNHPSATLTEVSKMFNKKWNTTIGMTTIRDILHEKNKWLSVSEHFEGNKRISAGKYHELEDALYRVFTEALDSNEVVTDEWLLKKARVIGKQMNVMEFRYSNGWLRGFKKRYLIAKCAASRANVSMYRKNTNSSSSMWPLASKKEAMMIQEQVNHDYTATDDGHSAPSNATITLQEAKAALIKVIDFVSCFTMRDQFLCPLISLLKYLEACNLPASDEGLVNIEIKQENDSPGDLKLSAIPEDSNFLDIKVEKMFHDGSDQFDNSMNRVENDASWNESYGLEADEGMQVPSASEKLIGVNEQTTKHIQDKEKYNIRKDMFIKFIEYVDEKACYKCTVCGKSYSTFDRCKRHIRVVHSGERPFKCLSCGKAFPEKCSLKVHSRVHSGEKPYLCTKCGKRLCTLSGLIVHMRCHSGEKPYTCQLCNKSFRYPSSLSDHRRVHSNEKPYKCSTCSKAFKSSSDLNVHRRCHTGERPYKCTICGMAFMRVNVHKAHMRRHTGEKPFACHLCYKAFAQKALLTKHIRVHTGERPFSCPVCGRCFSQNGSLYHHQKMHQK